MPCFFVKAIKNLKNNKASGEDLIINEYLKHSAPKMIQLYVKIFNAVFDSGKLPKKMEYWKYYTNI